MSSWRSAGRATLLAAAVAVAGAGCARGGVAFSDPRPARLSVRDLARLRWIEGDWVGTGVNQSAFHERYRFENDSTLLVESFDDSTRARVTETARFALRGGRLGPGPSTAATHLGRRSVTFGPQVPGRNWYAWIQRTPDEWTAELWWPPTPTRPERRATYRMLRIR